MSILIKGMEMPTNCLNCFLSRSGCRAVLKRMLAMEVGTWIPANYRHDDCPLVPVRPHGDLIDKKTVSENLASVLNKKNPPFSYPDWNDAIIAMLTAPTIIPAEEDMA